MDLPATRPVALPSRVVGSSSWWAFKSAQLGALIAASATASMAAINVATVPAAYVYGMLANLAWFGGLATVVAAGVGGAVGAVAPLVLDRVRGRVPLTVIVPAQAAIGLGTGALAMELFLRGIVVFSAVALHPTLELVLVGIAGAMGGAAALAWWLPFTIATVTGRRWPVTTAVGLGVPPVVLAVVYLVLSAL